VEATATGHPGLVIATVLAGFAALAIFGLGGCGGGGDERHFRIVSSAMEPTLRCAKPGLDCSAESDDEVTTRPDATLERGDIIAFDTPERAQEMCGAGGKFVKRVIGLAGEQVAVAGSGRVSVDGKPLDESSYIAKDRLGGETGTWQVTAGYLFVLGDNRRQSCDSRVWGLLSAESVIGRVVEIQRDGKTIPVRGS
jgi:signal peptidase I